jgi:hypothetical protein
MIRRRWVTGLAAVGLVVAAWLSVAHVESDDNNASGAGLRAATDSAKPVLTSDNGIAMHSVDDAIEFARARREKLRRVAGYTAVFSKTEFVARRLISQTMDLKFREQPFSVYVRGHSKRQPAREVIFVAGKNDDKLIFHEAGLKALITVNLKPDDPRALAENRYPITEIGMAKMLDTVMAIWEREKDIAPANVEVLLSGPGNLGSNEREEVQITHKERLEGLKFHRTRVSFERGTGFPVLVEQYDWPEQAGEIPPLVEQYLYADIKTNPGLTDTDFDRDNSEYKFGFASLP